MQRQGIVISLLPNNLAVVRLRRHTACGDCGACHLGDEGKNITMKARNDAMAKIGDMVSIELSENSVFRAAVIAYVIPLIFIFIGIFIGNIIGLSEGYSVILAIVLASFVFLTIKFYDKNFSKSGKFDVVLNEIISDSNIVNIVCKDIE